MPYLTSSNSINDLLTRLAADTADDNSPFPVFCTQEFIKAVKTGNDGAKQIFFPGEQGTPAFEANELSVAYACCKLAEIPTGNFNKAIQNCGYNAVTNFLKNNIDVIRAALIKKYAEENIFGGNSETLASYFQGIKRGEFIIAVTSPAFEKLGIWEKTMLGNNYEAQAVSAFIKAFIPDRYQFVMDDWSKNIKSDLRFENFEFIEQYYTENPVISSAVKSAVENAVNQKTQVNSSTTPISRGVYLPSGTVVNSYQYCERTSSYYLGAAVKSWLQSNAVTKYGYYRGDFDNHVKITEKVADSECPKSQESGCVAPGTLITLADGQNVPIEKIKPNTRILSEDGKISVTSDEFITNKNIRCFYGFNDYAPFLSEEHAVRTSCGWRSLNPTLSNSINPHYNVEKLREGDTVVILKKSRQGDLVFEEEKVEKIVVKEAKEIQFTGYDLHFREGYNSYFANGILCLLNYPEITIKRVTDRLETMPENDILRFAHSIEDNYEIFAGVFGADSLNQLIEKLRSLKNDKDNNLLEEEQQHD